MRHGTTAWVKRYYRIGCGSKKLLPHQLLYLESAPGPDTRYYRSGDAVLLWERYYRVGKRYYRVPARYYRLAERYYRMLGS